MKYAHHRNNASHFVTWRGFSIEVLTTDGADKLAEELNSLDRQLARTRVEISDLKRDLNLQIEAKNNHISLAASFVTAIRKSQQVLAEYVIPDLVKRSDRQLLNRYRGVFNDLLDILDDQVLVDLVRGTALNEEHIRKENGPIRVAVGGEPKRKVEVSTLNDWGNATHQITFDDGKHWTNVELDGDCFTACSDGKRSWSVDCIPLNNVVTRPQYANKTPEVESEPIGLTVHPLLGVVDAPLQARECEAMPPVMKSVNYFAPVLKRKERAAIEDALGALRTGSDTLPGTIRRLKKLLKRT